MNNERCKDEEKMKNRIYLNFSKILFLFVFITCTSDSKEEYFISYKEAIQYSDPTIGKDLKEVNEIFRVF